MCLNCSPHLLSSRSGGFSETIRLIPLCIIALQQSTQGHQLIYIVALSSEIPFLDALYIAFLSACSNHIYFNGLFTLSLLIFAPLIILLQEVVSILLFLTITQPTFVLASGLLLEILLHNLY